MDYYLQKSHNPRAVEIFVAIALIVYISIGVNYLSASHMRILNHPVSRALSLVLVCFFLLMLMYVREAIILGFLFSLALSLTISTAVRAQKNNIPVHAYESFFSEPLKSFYKDYLTNDSSRVLENAESNSKNQNKIELTTSSFDNSKNDIQSNVFNEAASNTEIRTFDAGYGTQGLGGLESAPIDENSSLGN
jgi:MFS superfamily sulfate permease-like transporter